MVQLLWDRGTELISHLQNEETVGYAWTTITARPLDSFICLSFHSNKDSYSSPLERSPGEQNLLRCEGQGFRRSQGIQLQMETTHAPSSAHLWAGLGHQHWRGTTHQAYSTPWPTKYSLHTAYASINTLNRKLPKAILKKKKKDKFSGIYTKVYIKFYEEPTKVFSLFWFSWKLSQTGTGL